MLNPIRLRPLALSLLIASVVSAQGPGSCGFHLDVITNDTSTHSAIADVPGAPGAQPGGLAIGSSGNPYTAWATPGTQIKVKLSIPAGTLSDFAATTPYGSGGVIGIYYAAGAPNIGIPPPPGSVTPCAPAASWVISILPLGGYLVDGLGVMTPPQAFLPSDPGFPNAFTFSANYPVGLPPITMQGVVITPGGLLAVTNGVSLIGGPSIWQVPVAFAPPTGCAWGPLDEGTATVTMPAGFQFYGTATGTGVVRPNGLVEFGPQAGTGCPYDQSTNDFGCAPAMPEVRPRVAVNLVDNDISVAPAPGNITGVTVEYALPTASAPARTIVRWKHASQWYTVPGNPILTDHTSSVVEFWGGVVPGGSPAIPNTIAVVRQEIHVGLLNDVHGALGISPGYGGQGYNGPPTQCQLIDVWTTWGGWYFTGNPSDALILNFLPTGSALLSNLAAVFTPIPGGAYRLEAY